MHLDSNCSLNSDANHSLLSFCPFDAGMVGRHHRRTQGLQRRTAYSVDIDLNPQSLINPNIDKVSIKMQFNLYFESVCFWFEIIGAFNSQRFINYKKQQPKEDNLRLDMMHQITIRAISESIPSRYTQRANSNIPLIHHHHPNKKRLIIIC